MVVVFVWTYFTQEVIKIISDISTGSAIPHEVPFKIVHFQKQEIYKEIVAHFKPEGN